MTRKEKDGPPFGRADLAGSGARSRLQPERGDRFEKNKASRSALVEEARIRLGGCG
jgi:hypothetical protein